MFSSLEHKTSPKRPLLRDDIAYILPMGIFLLFTQAGVWWPGFYPASYVLKTIIVAIALVILWPYFTKIRWNYWWLGILFGILGIVQWIAVDDFYNWFLVNALHLAPKKSEPFVPFEYFHSAGSAWAFIALRMAGATLLVPFMEEFFWRDFLWRTIQAPNNFKLADVGERDWKAWLAVSIAFSTVHGSQWFTAIVWGGMVGGLLMVTRSLGACIIMHAVTNLLLGIYVVKNHLWSFW